MPLVAQNGIYQTYVDDSTGAANWKTQKGTSILDLVFYCVNLALSLLYLDGVNGAVVIQSNSFNGETFPSGLEIQSSDKAILMGRNSVTTARICQFENTKSTVWSWLIGITGATTNVLNIGGSSGTYRAATTINFYAAAAVATATGTLIASITTAGFNLFNGTLNLLTGNQYQITPGSNPGQTTALTLYDPTQSSTMIKLGVDNIILSQTGTINLTQAQSGSVINVQANVGPTTINLPAAKAGLRFEFKVTRGSPLAATTTIHSNEGTNIYGSIISTDGTGVTAPSARSTMVIGTTATYGDRYEFFGDGFIGWILTGSTSVHTSVTFT
jgi:hypothetical protein